jgi:flavodoxin
MVGYVSRLSPVHHHTVEQSRKSKGVCTLRPVVLYSTKSGNTGKIAEAIASELNCELLRIGQNNLSPIVDLNNCDLIFIGTGIHFGNPNEDMVRFLKTTNLEEPKSFAVFLTWGGAGRTDKAVIAQLKMILESRGQNLIEDYYRCYGGRRFTLLRRGHPNDEDVKAAKNWAKKIVNHIH